LSDGIKTQTILKAYFQTYFKNKLFQENQTRGKWLQEKDYKKSKKD
jgi:hypothetical protein